MAKNTAVSDEEIIAAIVQHGTFTEAAKVCGISTREIRNRMTDADFMADYEAARDEIVSTALNNVNSHLSEAVDTIAEIMNDKDVIVSVRLSAAKAMLDLAAKLTATRNENDMRTRSLTKDANNPLKELDDMF